MYVKCKRMFGDVVQRWFLIWDLDTYTYQFDLIDNASGWGSP